MAKIFLAGHKGMVGSAILRALNHEQNEIITVDRKDLDLLNCSKVEKFFKDNKFDEVYIAAARVGGVNANNIYPANFLYENLSIQLNIINSAHNYDVNKILFLGSSCIYPKNAEIPLKENALLSGHLEATNEPYAIAKIAGIKLCESFNRQYDRDYRSLMPCNLYGPGDNYNLQNSHVIPALIRKFYQAKKNRLKNVSIWGSGKPMREFLHVDDLANASIFFMNLDQGKYKENTKPMLSHINIGSEREISIRELANKISDITGFKGVIKYDSSKPDGTMRKCLDCSLASSFGWRARVDLDSGLRATFSSFLNEIEDDNVRA
jgi:GDP-L-fucose synthase